MSQDSSYAEIIPVGADQVRGIDDPEGTPVTGLFSLSTFVTAMGLPVLLESHDLSATANCDINFTSGYMRYRIVGYTEPATDGVQLQGTFTTNGHTSQLTSNYAYNDFRVRLQDPSASVNQAVSQAAMRFTTNSGNASGERANFAIEVVNAEIAAPTMAMYYGEHANASGDTVHGLGGASHEGASIINGLRLSYSSGNFDVCKLNVYGWGTL